MKSTISFIFILLISFGLIYSKKPVSIVCKYPIDTCIYEPNLWLMDMDNDDKYDACLLRNCESILTNLNLNDQSTLLLTSNMTAQLINGSIELKNFLFNIYDPDIDKYICKLYYDSNIASAILEDYTDNGSEPSTYEEADNYFYTQQMGSTLLITKKADIDVQSVYLCSLDGRIISNLQNIEGWFHFSLDMSLEPSGMYLLRFITRERALTKRVIYIR